MKQRGFTVIELLVVIVILAVGGWLFFSEKARIDSVERDNTRKVAINAMYYNLEEVWGGKPVRVKLLPQSTQPATAGFMDTGLDDELDDARY